MPGRAALGSALPSQEGQASVSGRTTGAQKRERIISNLESGSWWGGASQTRWAGPSVTGDEEGGVSLAEEG